MRLMQFTLALTLTLAAAAASAGDLSVDLAPDPKNPASPQMGDNLSFHSVIRNTGATAVDGIIGWLSLVQIDPGQEQPVDLEDWSAHKAVTATALTSGETLEAEWPLRLIQAGTYRIVVSVVSRQSGELAASPFADFTVREKPVVESERVLPVAIGLPLLIAAALLWRRRAG
ncbi:MAG TPA: hypothetical protein VE914_15355 [Candidatus Angelobacter sp.]|nr:hypothetical protein [Candidatus Angelobacter sp.]